MKQFKNPLLQAFVDEMSVNERQAMTSIINRLDGIDNDILIRFNDDEQMNELRQLVLNCKPNSKREIDNILYVLRRYAEWLRKKDIVSNYKVYQALHRFKRNDLWEIAKENKHNKFISYKKYLELIDDIDKNEYEHNTFYYSCLIRCIYEGIYDKDLNVIKNLRVSDIQGDKVTLFNDIHYHTIQIPYNLADDLKELSFENVWTTNVRGNSTRNVSITGKYPDSVFKVEHRTNFGEENKKYYYAYYNKVNKIIKEYMGYKISPYHIYISGIMHRIEVNLEKENILLEEAFSRGNKKAKEIILKELDRCDCSLNMGELKELVSSHLEVFLE